MADVKTTGMRPSHARALRAGISMLVFVVAALPLVLAFGAYLLVRGHAAIAFTRCRRYFARRGRGVRQGEQHKRGRAHVHHHPALAEPATVLAQKLRAGEYSSAELVDAFIAQIERVNPVMNAVCARRYDVARAEAAAADALLKQARAGKRGWETLPPFCGVPCSMKECLAVAGMPQSSGVVARKAYRAAQDATVVARYKRAGFIILANTNVSELCMWYSSSNFVYGPSRNAYDPRRIVGGSSGGEAALISAAGAPCGIGSDIGGSIRMPAAFSGVFGHKPTGGLVPGTGQYPFTPYPFLTTGPLCRYSDDLWPLLSLLAGPDGQDGSCVPMQLVDVDLPLPRAPLRATMSPAFHLLPAHGAPGHADSSLHVVDRVEHARSPSKGRRASGSGSGRGTGSSVSTSSTNATPTLTPTHGESSSTRRGSRSRERARGAALRGRSTGATTPTLSVVSLGTQPDLVSSWAQVTVFKVADFPHTVRPRFTTPVDESILQAIDVAAATLIGKFGCGGVAEVAIPELADAFDLWAAVLNEADQPTFYDLMVEAHGRPLNLGWEVAKWSFGMSEATLPAIVLAAIEKVPQYLVPSRHAACLKAARELKERFHQTLAACNGVLLFPVHPTTSPVHELSLLRFLNCGYTQLWNVLEVPVTVVPMGTDKDGLPVAIQVIAARGFDRLTIAVAQALEHSGAAGWVPPRLALAASE